MRKRKGKKIKSEFDQKLLDLARVTRVVRGGRRFRFRATVAIGNRKGKVAIGIGKGSDVSDAMTKAFNKAKKSLVEVKLIDNTIPHDVVSKFKSARVLLRPAKKGKGIVVGGAVRQIVELAGIKDLSAKILGKGSKVNNAFAALEGLRNLSLTKEQEKTLEEQREAKKKEQENKPRKKPVKNLEKMKSTKKADSKTEKRTSKAKPKKEDKPKKQVTKKSESKK